MTSKNEQTHDENTGEEPKASLKARFNSFSFAEYQGYEIEKNQDDAWKWARVRYNRKEIELSPVKKQILALLILKEGKPVFCSDLQNCFENYQDKDATKIMNNFKVQAHHIKRQIEKTTGHCPKLTSVNPSHKAGQKGPYQEEGGYALEA